MILPDVLQPNLKVVFVGTAVGNKSAQRQAYYAGPGNKFYKTLYRCGFTDRLLFPEEFGMLPEFGIGLTDIAKNIYGNDNFLKPTDFDPDGFIAKIQKYQPKWVCFNGKQAASRLTGIKTSQLEYGEMIQTVGITKLYLAPSTSGAANGFWDEVYWRDLKHLLWKAQ